MRETIWKYPLEVDDYQVISTPPGAQALFVGVQSGTPCLWVQFSVDDPGEDVEYTVMTTGTGHQRDFSEWEYIGTYMLYGGDFVGHVYWKPA